MPLVYRKIGTFVNGRGAQKMPPIFGDMTKKRGITNGAGAR
ncbi:hypothetical protein GBL_3626 [Geobacillus kaustophilus GBlys]|uniref:Uncharacterized protein n=1 Tax=Geobacillus kaustophilus GBlys TaxID=1337888 RepID=U2Y7Q1_GEOKU|nr:hypothetical protein GBL_3626 [Geobacillus kaustophilus GBlys]